MASRARTQRTDPGPWCGARRAAGAPVLRHVVGERLGLGGWRQERRNGGVAARSPCHPRRRCRWDRRLPAWRNPTVSPSSSLLFSGAARLAGASARPALATLCSARGSFQARATSFAPATLQARATPDHGAVHRLRAAVRASRHATRKPTGRCGRVSGCEGPPTVIRARDPLRRARPCGCARHIPRPRPFRRGQHLTDPTCPGYPAGSRQKICVRSQARRGRGLSQVRSRRTRANRGRRCPPRASPRGQGGRGRAGRRSRLAPARCAPRGRASRRASP